MSAPNSQIVESLWDAYNFLKEIQDTTGDQHWGAGPLIERLRLAAVAAQSNGPYSEADTFVDAVSAMGFPKGWEHVSEEAQRIRANRSSATDGTER